MATPMAVMYFRILPSGLGGRNLVRSGRSCEIGRRRLMGEQGWSQDSTCVSCGTDVGLMRESFTRVGPQVDAGLRRCRQWRVRAMEHAEENPLGEDQKVAGSWRLFLLAIRTSHRAKQQAEQRKQAKAMFSLGQRAYGRGVYNKSVELLDKCPCLVQSWRRGLYRRLEASHPNKQIRRQAADLRYILEAPKLKISKEELVSIPIIERDYDRDSKSWSQKVRDSRRKPMPKSKSKDYLEDWLVWDPPRWERNPYFWVAFTVWLTLVGVSLMFQD